MRLCCLWCHHHPASLPQIGHDQRGCDKVIGRPPRVCQDETWPQEIAIDREDILEMSKSGAYALTLARLIEVDTSSTSVPENVQTLCQKVHDRWDD